MKQSKQELDAIINKAADDIRNEQIDVSIINASATRVWERVSREAAQNSSLETSYSEGINKMKNDNNADQIRGCADFQSLIPDYLNGKLSAARTLLLEDHSNECIPCRMELKAQRENPVGAVRSSAAVTPLIRRNTRRNANIVRWSLAAALLLCLGVGGIFVFDRLDMSGRTLAATVENTDGAVFVVSDLQSRELAAGEQIQKGERIRTAKDSNAVLKLADGSTVEMRERSEFSVSENRRGVTIQLERGDVIVEAAKQDQGRLYVQTPDSLVSVKGTIFAVESGTKGSRVSVVEGEVQVSHAGKDETLNPGDQTTSSAALDRTPVAQNVAWSRNAARYTNLVSELAKLRREVNQKIARPGVRNESRFVNLIPENTVFFAALPNLTETLAESQRIMQERIKQNPALAEWWKGNKGSGPGINEQAVSRIHEFGSHLGNEIVVAAEMNGKGEPSGILVLGEVKDPAGFRTFLNGQLSKVAKDSNGTLNVRVIDDPMTAEVKTAAKSTGENRSEELYVWINNDIFAASPKIESLRGFATTMNAPAANRAANSSFHQRIADIYRDGAGLVVAADLEKIMSQAVKGTTPEEQRHVDGLKKLGVMNLRHFVAEQKDVNGKTFSQAALTFNEPDRGIASWLAAPASMGALDFISPNANVVAAFVVKQPALLVDDLLGFMETVQPDVRQQLGEIEKQQGFSLRDDFAAPLGGEFAFAIDGPLLPTPSWKIVLEVYDQAKLQQTFERAVEKLNQFSVLHGKGKLAIETTTAGGRTYYAIKSADAGLEVHYTYANGYLVVAPSRVLLEQSVNNRESGNVLARSTRFLTSLPQDGNTNFSAIFYHDLAGLAGPLAEKMKNAGGEQSLQALTSLDANAPPTLAYVYAQGDRITIAANTEGGPFGLSPASLLGVPNSFEMQHILSNAMGDKDVQKRSE